MKRTLASAASLAVALLFCVTAIAHAAGPTDIEKQVAETFELLRGIDFKSEPVVKHLDAGSMKDFEGSLKLFYGYGKEESGKKFAVWDFFGLTPKGAEEKTESLFSAAPRAMYDPSSGDVLFTDNAVTPGWNSPLIQKTMETLEVGETDFVLSRVLDYSLLNSNFGIGPIFSDKGMSSDRKEAALALLHGDAALMTMEYLVRNQGVSVLWLPNPEAVVKQFFPLVSFRDKKKLEEIPALVYDDLKFPFLKGITFAVELRKTGGFPLLNSAYSSLPLSTEQILHPEKYFEKRDNPVEIKVRADIDKSIPGAKLVLNDVLGEWGIRNLLSAMMSDKGEAESAAEGWGGDRFLLFRKEDGSRFAAFYTTWDDAEHAALFSSVFKRALGKLKDGKYFDVTIIGKDVVSFIGADEETAKAVTEELWQSMKAPAVVPPPVPEKPSAESVLDYQNAFAVIFTGDAGVQPPAGDMWRVEGDTFINGKYHYKVTRPNADWSFQRLHLGNQFVSEFTAVNTKQTGANFTVFTFNKYDPSAPDPIDEMVDFMGGQLKDFKKIDDKRMTIAGYPARRATFSGFAIMPLKIAYTEIFADNFVYMITWWALTSNFDKLVPEYEQFMKKFVIEK
ncbi:MAG TPA: hypothetical protein PLQ76_03355 [bacterium]|nr:hypothetical protein [bacterium]